ncbi:MAG: hypothetical protein LBH16_00095 [Treponema sp.]|jgi:23S rRNA pseudouridine1911/1915/1917 synthase|nr:hypothetical protein [Treponema sp.]
MDSPYILEETGDYAVVFKPPQMHSRPQGTWNSDQEKEISEPKTLLEWYAAQQVAAQFAHVYDIMHRLDYETHGLALIAKNGNSFHFFKSLQDKGEFVKEYSAVCLNSTEDENDLRSALNQRFGGIPHHLPGFPPCPRVSDNIIESWFRPFGSGRKQVRPVIDDGKKHGETAKDKGAFYKTEIISADKNVFKVRIKRGFRHQIRCHLCWIGFPILNDPLYSPAADERLPGDNYFRGQTLALRAHALYFTDPANGGSREYRIQPI